jgi:hypothetical protein
MGHLLNLKCAHSPLNLRILSSKCVPVTLTTVQVPNVALTQTKRITVRVLSSVHTVIRFVSFRAKFGIWTVVGLNGALVDAKLRTFICPKCVL